MRFTKMHGLGNDYLFLDAFREPALAARRDLPETARRMCDRHRGVGADGLIIIEPPHGRGHMRMRIINADGSDGGVCGNGTRCAAKLALERGHLPAGGDGAVAIDTGPRLVEVWARTDSAGRVVGATVDMGAPDFGADRIPVDLSLLRPAPAPPGSVPALYHVDHRTGCFVSMGNPHMVCFIEEPVEQVHLESEGPRLENHPAFPRRINVHMVNIVSRAGIVLRPWERGAGATQACATGACAAVACGAALGLIDRRVTVRMPGGALEVEVEPAGGRVLMTGEAVEVFSGEWPG